MNYRSGTLRLSFLLSFVLLFTLCFSSLVFAEGTVDDTYDISNGTGTEEERTCQVSVNCASSFSVTIPKVISLSSDLIGDDHHHEAKYDIKVKGNIGGNQEIYVNPAGTLDMASAGKPKVQGTVVQSAIKYRLSTGDGTNDTHAATFSEKEGTSVGSYTDSAVYIPDTVLNGNDGFTLHDTGVIRVPKLSAGNWSGTYTYDIKLQTIPTSGG